MLRDTLLLVILSCAALLGCGREASVHAVLAESGAKESVDPPASARATEAAPEVAATIPEPLPDLGEAQAALEVGAALAGAGSRWRLGYRGLPRNSRQTVEGYWLGSRPSAANVDELFARGVRAIVSGIRLEEEVLARARALGVHHVNVPFGGRFPNHRLIVEGIAGFDPREVFIHCEHGGDRSGAILAFLLAVRHQWPIERALLAVAFPGQRDVRGLVEVLEERGFRVSSEEQSRYVGIYSAERNGGFGGLKIRGPAYRRLVSTTIDAIHASERLN